MSYPLLNQFNAFYRAYFSGPTAQGGERVHVFSLSLAYWLLAVVIMCSIGCSAAYAEQNWLMNYQNKSSNALVWDKQHRFQTLIKTVMPARFAQSLWESFSGPPDPVFISENRYVTASACEAHDCPEKSFFWYDTRTNTAVGATLGGWQLHFNQGTSRFDHPTLVVASNVTLSQLPEKSIFGLRSWLQEHSAIPTKVSFINQQGRNEELPPALFVNNDVYHPANEGPSFNCEQAYSRIDEAICQSPTLSQLDIATYRLVQQIHNGYDTESARQQLAEFQRHWLAQREQECFNAVPIDECLSKAYKTQQDKLNNWAPH